MKGDDTSRTDGGDVGGLASAEADSERRIRTLSELAREAAASAPARQPALTATARIPLRAPKRPRPIRQLLLGPLAAAVDVAAGIGVSVWRAQQPAKATAQSIPATLSINLAKSRLYCPQCLTGRPTASPSRSSPRAHPASTAAAAIRWPRPSMPAPARLSVHSTPTVRSPA